MVGSDQLGRKLIRATTSLQEILSRAQKIAEDSAPDAVARLYDCKIEAWKMYNDHFLPIISEQVCEGLDRDPRYKVATRAWIEIAAIHADYSLRGTPRDEAA